MAEHFFSVEFTHLFLLSILSNSILYHRSDIRSIIITLLHSSVVEVNSTVSERDLRTALHFAAAMGNLPVVQILIWVIFYIDT